jgi:hypothetical protein
MASVPFMLQHVANVAQPTLSSDPEAAGSDRPVIDGADVNLRTEVVREAPARPASPKRGDSAGKKVTVIPRSAVTTVDGRTVVFVAEKELRLLVATPVELGSVEGEEQRVLAGLSPGQVVVTESVGSLDELAVRK